MTSRGEFLPEMTIDQALAVAIDVLFESDVADALEAYLVLRHLREVKPQPRLKIVRDTVRRCLTCPEIMEGRAPDARYCSPRCRQRGYYRRLRKPLPVAVR